MGEDASGGRSLELKPYWRNARVCRDTGWRKSCAKVKFSGAVEELVVQSRTFFFSKSGRVLPVIFVVSKELQHMPSFRLLLRSGSKRNVAFEHLPYRSNALSISPFLLPFTHIFLLDLVSFGPVHIKHHPR